MASETKVEPAEAASEATRLHGAGVDDEDVSLDELMMSDALDDDDDEEDEATDIHPPLVRDIEEEDLSAESRVAPVSSESPEQLAGARTDLEPSDAAPESEPAHFPAGARSPAHVPAGARSPAHVPAGARSPAHDPAGARSPAHVPAEARSPAHSAVLEPDDVPEVVVIPEADASADEGVSSPVNAAPIAAARELSSDAAETEQEATADAEMATQTDLESAVADDESIPESRAPDTVQVPAVVLPPPPLAAATAAEVKVPPAAPLPPPPAEPQVARRRSSAPPPAPADFAQEARHRSSAPPPPPADFAQEVRHRSSAPPPRPKRSDAPLPSFDIPELEAGAAGAGARPSPPPPAPLLSAVSEAGDEDAVTNIGLPLPDTSSDYPKLEVTGFESGDPDIAVLREFDPGLSIADSRRATTRLIPRIDASRLPPPPAAPKAERPGIGQWLTNAWQSGEVRSKAAWVLDNVLPPLSLVLLGSAIGAGIMLLQPDQPAPRPEVQQQTQALATAPAPKRAASWLESAEAGDPNALAKIEKLSPRERSAEMTLAFEAGNRVRRLAEFNALVANLDKPNNNADPDLASRIVDYATTPETLLPAFQILARWDGSRGPDLLYAVWERAPGGSAAQSLAQQLLQGADQRSKASPALLVALDLRNAQSCEDYARLLPAAERDGDQRSSGSLRALQHRDGCGKDGRSDCYRCLRKNTELRSALKATEGRPGPQL